MVELGELYKSNNLNFIAKVNSIKDLKVELINMSTYEILVIDAKTFEKEFIKCI